jgi:long-chain acyl-CoA synthetase
MQLTLGLHRSVQQNPDAVATVFRGRRRTYREVMERVARLAAALRALGMQKGDRVGMLALNSDRYLEYVLAVWWAGGVINPVNVRWSAREIAWSLDDCDTRMVFIDDHHLHHADALRGLLIHADDGPAPPGMLSFEALIDDLGPIADVFRHGDDLASIMYTGGTTGLPKGVMQTHANLWCSAMQRLVETPALRDAPVLHAAPFFHMAGLGRAIGQWIAGGPQVILPSFDAADVLRAIREDGVRELQLVPTMIQTVLDHPDFVRTDMSRVRRLTYGASPISPALLERITRCMPNVALVNSYGLTEACSNVAANPHETSGVPHSVGRGGVAVLVKIVDADGREVPRGGVGEIVVRGPNITSGYWNRPDETAQAIRDGWLHTGDGAYMDDAGYLFIADRIKDMIVSGGENVYSAEVENTLMQHPAVASCAVIGVPHEKWGEAVHAVVVLKPHASADEHTLREHCRAFIAGYKCPKTVEFRDALPLSAAGKVLKRVLRDEQ